MSAIPPGEGERRAAVGLRGQYVVAARLTLAHLAELEWVKVADPEAGKADDFQLATTSNQLHALQVRWGTFPSSYTFANLVNGTDPLIRGLAQAWQRLKQANPSRSIRVHLVSNHVAATRPNVQGQALGTPGHFAAFIARGMRPIQKLLRMDSSIDIATEAAFTQWEDAWRKMREASGLDVATFWEFVADFDIDLGVGADTFLDRERARRIHQRDVAELADLFFTIAAEPGHVVELTRAQLIERLGWGRRLAYRNRHVFPVPTAYEPNEEAVARLLSTIEAHPGGYIGVIAPAGAGKSTLLTATDLPAQRVVRYYAFTPDAPDPSTGRGESENFFFDVVKALDDRGLHTRDVIDPTDRIDLKERFLSQLDAAHRDWVDDGRRTIVVVDGIDHIPREQNPARSLIHDLPDPTQVPDGVYIILGTQTLDVLSASVQGALADEHRSVHVPPLSSDAVLAIAASAGPGRWLDPENKQALIDSCEGHALALTYLLEELSQVSPDGDGALSPQAREQLETVLSEGREYRGDIEARYEGYWRRVASHTELHQLLGVVARLRSPINLEWLLTWNDATVVAQFAQVTAPYFLRDDASWTFIHNSFRLFLRGKTATIGDMYSEVRNRSLHAQAADVCAQATERWASYRDEELAQRLHAEQHEQVLQLATPQRLRSRIENLAPLGAIRLDSNLALQSAGALGDAIAVVRLALVKFELEIREFVLEPQQVALSLIRIGEYERGFEHLLAGRELRVAPAKALEAAAWLLDAQRVGEAGELLRAVGSLRFLLETHEQRRFHDRDTADLIQWWVSVHARIRSPEDIFREIEEHLPQDPATTQTVETEAGEDNAIEQYRHVALFELARSCLRAGNEEVRSRIVAALAGTDPGSAAAIELEPRVGGSADAIIGQVDAALAQFGVTTDPSDPGRWSHDEVTGLPAHVRLKAAEMLAQIRSYEPARTLLRGWKLPAEREFGDQEQRALWQAYRLHRLRHLLDLRDEIGESAPSDPALSLFTRVLREVAEVDAALWRSKLDSAIPPPEVMGLVERMHRVYEIPWRDRKDWNSWYVPVGAAAKFFTQLIDIAAQAHPDAVGRLWEIFVGAWSDSERAHYWPHETRIAVVQTLGRSGVSRAKVIAELDRIAEVLASDRLDAQSRIEVLLKLADAFSDHDVRERALETLRHAIRSSFVPGAHDKDDQLEEWVERFREFVIARPTIESLRDSACTMAERLSWAHALDARTASAATDLIKLTFGIDAGLAVDMADWFIEQGVLDGPEALAGIIQGASDDTIIPASLVAEVVRSLYMPAAIPPLKEAAARLVARGGEDVRVQLEDGIRRWVLPSLRARWGEEVSAHALAAPFPYIGSPSESTSEPEATSEARAILLEDGTELTEEAASAGVTSMSDFSDLLRRVVAPSDSYRATPLGEAFRKVADEVDAAEAESLLRDFDRVRADSGGYAALAAELLRRSDNNSAQLVIDAARRAITMRGWARFWDGGTRQTFWKEVVDAGGDSIRVLAIADLATGLRIDAVQLSSFVHDLPKILAIIGLDPAEAWTLIDDFVDALCRNGGPARWVPMVRNESGTAALLRYVAGFAGHPVRVLEWGARVVLRAALSDPVTAGEAATVLAQFIGRDEAADEMLLSIVSAVGELPTAPQEILRATIASSMESPDQIVRDVAQRAALTVKLDVHPRPRRPLPLSYSLAVPPLPPRAAPMIGDDGIAVLNPLDPRAHLGPYDMLLEERIANLSDIDPAALVRRGASLADEYARRGKWTSGGVRAHAARLKATGWLLGYRPWALKVGRRGAAVVIAQLGDARVLPDPYPLTFSDRLEMIDPTLEFVEPEALPEDVLRPARRTQYGADSGDWIGDTAEAAAIYDASASSSLVLSERTSWTELSWKLGHERRVSVVRKTSGELIGGRTVEAEPRLGALRATENLLRLGAFYSAGAYRRYATDLDHDIDEDDDDGFTPLVVGAQTWWAELRWGEWIALNPEVGLRLGWHLSDAGLFRWVDSDGREMVRSRWWIQANESHQPPHFGDDAGEGWQVVASPHGWDAIIQTCGPLERWSAVARSIMRSDQVTGDVLTIRAVGSRKDGAGLP